MIPHSRLRISSDFRMSHRKIASFLAALLMTAFVTSDAHAPPQHHSTTSWKMLSRSPESRRHEIDQVGEPREMQISKGSVIDSPSFTNLNGKHQGADDLIGSREEEDPGKSDEWGSKSHRQASSKAVEFHIGRRRLISQLAEIKSRNSKAVNMDEVTALLAFKNAISHGQLDNRKKFRSLSGMDGSDV
jgi:hypothetical protein